MKTLKFSFFVLTLLLGLTVAWSVATPSQLTAFDITGGACMACTGEYPMTPCSGPGHPECTGAYYGCPKVQSSENKDCASTWNVCGGGSRCYSIPSALKCGS